MSGATNPYPLGLLHVQKVGANNITWKGILVSSDGTEYVYDAAHQYHDNAADDSTDPSFCETGATNYEEVALTVAIQWDVANSRLEYVVTDPTFSTLGNGNGC